MSIYFVGVLVLLFHVWFSFTLLQTKEIVMIKKLMVQIVLSMYVTSAYAGLAVLGTGNATSNHWGKADKIIKTEKVKLKDDLFKRRLSLIDPIEIEKLENITDLKD